MKITYLIMAGTMMLAPLAAVQAQSAPCGNETECPENQGIWAQRLQLAWKSSVTTQEQRQKMADIIALHRSGDVTDWPAAASEYFSWKSGEPFDLLKQAKAAPPPPYVGPNYGAMRKAAETYIRHQLIDPSSATFEWPYGFTRSSWRRLFKSPIQGIMTCGYVNSRNRMGGYSGQSAFVVVMAGEEVSYFDMDDTVGRGQGVVEHSCLEGAKTVLPPPQKGMLDG